MSKFLASRGEDELFVAHKGTREYDFLKLKINRIILVVIQTKILTFI